MLFFSPAPRGLAKGLGRRRVLLVATHLEGRHALLVVEVAQLGRSRAVQPVIQVCSSHLTRSRFQRTFFLRAKLLRERRFIPRIVLLNCVYVLAGVFVAHRIGWAAAVGALTLALLLALGLGALRSLVRIELAPLQMGQLGSEGPRLQIF